MQTYRFSMRISYEDFMQVYQSQIKSIVVREYGGKTISIPALKFTQFVTHQGVVGAFQLELDRAGKFLSLQRI